MRIIASLALLIGCAQPSSTMPDDDAPPDAQHDEPPAAIDYGEVCSNGLDDDGDGRIDEDCAPSLFAGVFAPAVAADPSLAPIEDAAGRALSVIQTYRSTTSVDAGNTRPDLAAIFARGQVPHLNIEMSYPKAAYASPAADPLAADLAAMGDAIAGAMVDAPGSRILLTIGAEMNGIWTSWGCLSPQTFIALYRHAHDVIMDKLAAAGIDRRRARWVFGPDSHGGGTTDCKSGAAYYPGHAYVDLLGLSAYRIGTASVDEAVLQPMTALFDGTGIPEAARRDRFVLLQTGSREVAGRDAWISELFTRLGADPRVAGIIYFNASDWAVANNGPGWNGFTEALRDAPVADRALEGTFAPHFWDVSYSDPGFAEIQTLRDHGLTSGCSTAPAQFCPDALIDRSAAAAFLTGAFGVADDQLACAGETCTEVELADAITALGGVPPPASTAPATRARAAVLIVRGAKLAPHPL